jgi:hypothetical protein
MAVERKKKYLESNGEKACQHDNEEEFVPIL